MGEIIVAFFCNLHLKRKVLLQYINGQSKRNTAFVGSEIRASTANSSFLVHAYLHNEASMRRGGLNVFESEEQPSYQLVIHFLSAMEWQHFPHLGFSGSHR
ncbi:hypothetical protein ACH5RR_008009 [Cinchona calisaya]|uniref:Uncharacterized protein n=1 Tax=Cinchona calisaya TaxID=153742 RepID=A0ABD3AAG6_9GENT